MILDRVRLRTGTRVLFAVPWHARRGVEASQPALDPSVARRQLRDLDVHQLRRLVELCDGTACATPVDLEQRVAALVEKRRLIFIEADSPRRPVRAGPPRRAGPITEEIPWNAAPEYLPGWIEIRLQDEDGRPVPRARYRVRLPNRQLRRGRLDQDGFARLDRIPSGRCEVSFPEYDYSSWERA